MTAATGNIGRKVVDHLLERGATAVRALTIDPDRAALPPTVEVVTGYLRRVDTLPGVFDGVSGMYLAPTPETVAEVLRLAREAGVEHVVDLSGEPETWWGDVTRAVENSGIPWTHLWPGDFMENSLVWADQIRRTGAVHEPYPQAASSPIAMDDIASVAATALLDTAVQGKAHLLTGPETLTRAQQVAHIGAALGRDIPFLTASREETLDHLRPAMGENAEWFVDNVLAMFDEEPMYANNAVEEITGQPATTFAGWARAHAHEFR
ncbi:NAD(P)H-binding protein [Prauserella oleivorans]|uniref:NAD(P)H-binding protein n=1 Tax=Prauserella oleivorans TaxID=1478153 RepID=UPI0036715E97